MPQVSAAADHSHILDLAEVFYLATTGCALGMRDLATLIASDGRQGIRK